MRTNRKDIISKFSKINIAVIGDVMLDQWIYGEVNRISAEADVPIVLGKNIEYALGGAANCAANIKSLSGKVDIFGLIGEDEAGKKIKKLFQQNKIAIGNLITNDKSTIQKIRISGPHNQIVRLDWEDNSEINKIIENRILNKLEKNFKKYQIIVLSDYNKGLLTKNLTQKIIQKAKQSNIPVIADIKPKNLDKFIGASVITPSFKEAIEMSGLALENTDKAVAEMAKIIKKKTGSDVIITRGAKGMSIYNGRTLHIPTQAKEVYEVAGAGDTVVAALALCIATGASLEQSAEIANMAAGIAVSKHGTTTVQQKELINALQD